MFGNFIYEKLYFILLLFCFIFFSYLLFFILNWFTVMDIIEFRTPSLYCNPETNTAVPLIALKKCARLSYAAYEKVSFFRLLAHKLFHITNEKKVVHMLSIEMKRLCTWRCFLQQDKYWTSKQLINIKLTIAARIVLTLSAVSIVFILLIFSDIDLEYKTK